MKMNKLLGIPINKDLDNQGLDNQGCTVYLIFYPLATIHQYTST